MRRQTTQSSSMQTLYARGVPMEVRKQRVELKQTLWGAQNWLLPNVKKKLHKICGRCDPILVMVVVETGRCMCVCVRERERECVCVCVCVMNTLGSDRERLVGEGAWRTNTIFDASFCYSVRFLCSLARLKLRLRAF